MSVLGTSTILVPVGLMDEIEFEFDYEYEPPTDDCRDHAGTGAQCNITATRLYKSKKPINCRPETLELMELQIIENGC